MASDGKRSSGLKKRKKLNLDKARRSSVLKSVKMVNSSLSTINMLITAGQFQRKLNQRVVNIFSLGLFYDLSGRVEAYSTAHS